MSFFKKGFQEVIEATKRIEARKSEIKLPNMYKMKEEETGASIVFTDAEPETAYEHPVQQPSEPFPGSELCIKDVYPDDPACCTELGDRTRNLIGYHTVVDLRENANPELKKYDFELKLYKCKLGTLNRLKAERSATSKKFPNGTPYTGKIWNVFRTGDKSPNVGSSMSLSPDDFDEAEIFEKATYRGVKIKDIFDKANKLGGDELKKVTRLFNVELDKAGKIVMGKLPSFNYEEIFKSVIKTPEAMRLVLKTRIKEEKKKPTANIAAAAAFGFKSESRPAERELVAIENPDDEPMPF